MNNYTLHNVFDCIEKIDLFKECGFCETDMDDIRKGLLSHLKDSTRATFAGKFYAVALSVNTSTNRKDKVKELRGHKIETNKYIKECFDKHI